MKHLVYAVVALLCGVTACFASAAAAPAAVSGAHNPTAHQASYLQQAGYWESRGRNYNCRKVWLGRGEWEMRCRPRYHRREYYCDDRYGWGGSWGLRCRPCYDCDYYGRRWRHYDYD